MARLRREVGIRPVSVNLPARVTPGPAIVRTAQTVAGIAFEKQADKRTQEAQLAAAAIDFERDGQGNLISPSLPIGENGLVGPSIYDRAYTKMVSARYLQQTQIDVSERLNLIATEHMLDPSGFREVAEGYVAKVTELAPDMLRGDVNNTAQIKMVEHFNHIIREKAEFDFNESRNVHVNSINTLYDDLHGYTVSGASDEIVGAQMLKIRAAIEEGRAMNYWDDAGVELQKQSMDQQFAVASIIGQITKLADDPLTHAAAIAQLTEFALGEGTIKMVDELGTVTMEPVADVLPNTADRDAIAAVGISIIEGKERGRAGLSNATDQRQNDQFDEWYLSHAMKMGGLGQGLDQEQLRAWFQKADFANNEPLEKRILAIMQGEWAQNSLGGGTAAERRAALALSDVMRVQSRVRQEYFDKHGIQSEDELSPEQQMDLRDVMWRTSGPVDIPQSQTMAEVLTPMYDSMAGYEVDFRTSDLEDIQNWIDRGAANSGVITWEMSVPLNSMLQSGNDDQINRALDIGRMMFDHPAIKNNMASDTAMGRNGEALAYLFENSGPGRIQANLVTDTLKNFNTPGYSPHKPWSGKTPDERESIMETVADELDGKFTALFPSGHEVSSFSGILRPDLAPYPAEMQEQIFNAVRSRAAFLDPENGKTVRRHVNMAIQEVVREQGWVPSKLGWTETRFTDKRPAVHAWSQHAPEAFYRDPEGNVDSNVMLQINADFQTHLDRMHREMPRGTPKLIAGENAFLRYNAEQTEITPGRQTHPNYNIVLMQVDDDGQFALNDRYTEGDHFVVNFELAHITGNKKTMEEHRRRQQVRARIREQQQNQFTNPGTAQ